MDLFEICGGRLDVIEEESEHLDLSRDPSRMEGPAVGGQGRGATQVQRGALQRFSVDTNDSLRFEPCDTPSPTGADDGQDDVFKDTENQNDVIRNKLQEKVSEMENFAGHLEEIFLTVEENFGRREQHLEQHYNDVLQTLSQRYDDRAAALQDEKKSKLEALYGQLLDCGRALDSSKELIESAQEVHRCHDKRLFLKMVMPTIKRIEDFAKDDMDLTLSTSLEFTTPLSDLSDVKTMMDSINVVPAPSAPVINPQSPNSASQTSLRVCWSLFSDDTVEFYELYYRPVLEDCPASDPSAPPVNKVKVKETHCTVSDLLPNAQYELWVTATNITGISPASEKALYMTVPCPPVLNQRGYLSCPEAALIRWESGNTNPVDSYTVEIRELSSDGAESDVKESIVAVPSCQCLVQLHPGQSYVISVRAVNIGGPSERSQGLTVHTTGTYFSLLEDSSHHCLCFSEDTLTISYGYEDPPLSAMAFDDTGFTRCVAVLGELIPVRGCHYWEVEVDDETEYRVGVAYEDTDRNSYLGANNTSWCMRHILTPTRHKYEFLHNGWSPDLRITVNPVRIGVALDYEHGTLSFYNVDLKQHLHTFQCHFRSFVHPCFGLDNPGELSIHNGIETPKFTFI
ncbi:fibronectin type III and SPRY domain-containing protein 2 [Periophthalmus magnuspinnatus]|uniref:fibronectin type III and SPRY domain-containing protein 2 n=1 Tax=Periophthalmus magnuspinnatus TaxID=409849 RepID=UPI00145BA3F7|nr:fibronectin type III and SPRY domain-containing protein 2 [Periophthalmus magnuspinnatus]XP_055086978.1 fibronectin type III and SPRY domain-containing protein 2 [Periophthalmus magnuspinnatus]